MRTINTDYVLNNINLKVKNTKETPREILETVSPSIDNIPISGGWGYTKDDCVIINKDNSSVGPIQGDFFSSKSEPFDGVSFEYFFVEKRIYLELITFRNPGEKYHGIGWQQLEQNLVSNNNRYYDHLRYLVKCHIDKGWDDLVKKYQDNNLFEDDPKGLENHQKERDKLLYCYKTDYWFDITSSFPFKTNSLKV